MELYLVRHAVAHPRDAQRWPDDGSRPPTSAGEDRFPPRRRGGCAGRSRTESQRADIDPSHRKRHPAVDGVQEGWGGVPSAGRQLAPRLGIAPVVRQPEGAALSGKVKASDSPAPTLSNPIPLTTSSTSVRNPRKILATLPRASMTVKSWRTASFLNSASSMRWYCMKLSWTFGPRMKSIPDSQ